MFFYTLKVIWIKSSLKHQMCLLMSIKIIFLIKWMKKVLWTTYVRFLINWANISYLQSWKNIVFILKKRNVLAILFLYGNYR